MEERNELLITRLEEWYVDNARDLPWRRTCDAYCIWVSEIILQQTRVAQGYDYYLRSRWKISAGSTWLYS